MAARWQQSYASQQRLLRAPPTLLLLSLRTLTLPHHQAQHPLLLQMLLPQMLRMPLMLRMQLLLQDVGNEWAQQLSSQLS